MSVLIAVLSTGKGTWQEVLKVINAEDWEKVFLVTNDFGKDKFTMEKEHEFIVLNENQSLEICRDIIINTLKDKVSLDVGVNFISGAGKEHMALMAALFKLGVGIRMVYEKDGIKEL